MGSLLDQAGLALSDLTRLNGPGSIRLGVWTSPPGGTLWCDGSEVSELLYPALFAICGTQYNTGGEAPGNFRLPDFRGRSPMGSGTGPGLTPRANGDYIGEEDHVLIAVELAIHTHLQNAHTHTHTDPGHNHTQNAHGHSLTDPGHNHTQNAHTHTQNAHTHTQNAHLHLVTIYSSAGVDFVWGPYGWPSNRNVLIPATSGESTTINQTATNQNATAVNQNTTPTNISNTTGATVANQTATNIANSTGVTNDNATAVNQTEGGDVGHNTIHPSLVCYVVVQY